MASRRIEDLVPEVQEMAREHVLRCADAKIELLIYCTLRDAGEQARLYRQGRTPDQVQVKIDQLRSQGFPQLAQLLADAEGQTGAKVTFAGPGESFHQYAMAYDCVPMVKGKPVWSTGGESGAIWRTVGDLGKASGLEWAGDWTRFREFPHFQSTGGRSVRDLMNERFGKPAAPAATGAAADLESVHTAPAGPSGSVVAAALGLSESDALRQALNVATTLFLVFGSQPGVSDAAIQAASDIAQNLAGSFGHGTWMTFWAHQPAALAADLKNLIWPGGDQSPVVRLSLGTGIARQRTNTYSMAQVADSNGVFDAFLGL
jgi:peptidoglycan L-alanyl-D-glutamate endopeptidase CwlK